MIEWQPMDTAPRDGTEFDVLCRSKDNVEIVVPRLKYGHAPMDKKRMILWGSQNFLSPYLEPIGWRSITHEPNNDQLELNLEQNK